MKFEVVAVSLGAAIGLLFGCVEKASAEEVPPLIQERPFYKPTAFGVHMFSVHSERMDDTAGRPWNNANPGLYLRWDRWTAGTYYNSIRKQSVYAGYAYPLHENVDIVFGAVTGYNGPGYSSSPVMPMVIPSVHFKVAQNVSARINIALGVKRGSASAINFALEWKLD